MTAPPNDTPANGTLTNDQLVDDYFRSAARAFAALPPERAAELLADLRDHIADERAALDPETQADVRGILERLGDPQLISAEARHGERPVSAVPAARYPVSAPTYATTPRPRRTMWLWIAVAAVAGFCILLTLLGVGFFAVGADTGPQEAPPVPVSSPTPAAT